MAFLNYHHLRYFRAVANENNLTRAARNLKISQSALSIQLRKLEESLGQKLFEREHKKLILTETGHLVLGYAESIFRNGEEMMDRLQHRTEGRRQVLRVGSVATMSRNFQIEFLRPLLKLSDVELVIRSGSLRELLEQLEAHTLDFVFSNLPVRRDGHTRWHCHLLDEQPVSLVGRKVPGARRFKFPEDLRTHPVLLPSLESNIRAAFDLLMDQAGIRPLVAAEVDDMAMLRLLARDTNALALVPTVVVRDELKSGLMVERYCFPNIKKSFYAITADRRFPNPLLKELLRGVSI
jgi:LysR family transcriptional regulator, transcriptional activator of nhaA